MLFGPAKAHLKAIPLIDRAPINPPDPIAFRAADARSAGQGRRPVLRVADLSSAASRPRNVGRRRSLALDRSEHDGRLMACRDGGSCAISRAITAMIIVGILHSALPMVALAETPTNIASHSISAQQAGRPFAAHIIEASQRFGIPEHWIAAVLRAESAGDVHAVSSAGAMGLMQIMPGTWTELRVRHRLGDDPFDVRDNVLAGTAYLREMWDRYGNVAAMLAAYNAGPGRYDEYLSAGRALPAETRAYVAALVPVLDGDVPPDGRSPASSPPSDWRDAPLFVGRSNSASAAGQAHSDDHFDHAAGSIDGIFVARSGEEPVR